MVDMFPHRDILFIGDIQFLKRRMELDPGHTHIIQSFDLFDHIITVRMQTAKRDHIVSHDLTSETIHIGLSCRF